MDGQRLHPSDARQLSHDADETIEAEIERRVAARCKAEAFFWRFRLIAAESVMMGALVAAAGIALDKPATPVLRAALLVGASCFASGILLLGLTGLGARIAARLRGRGRR
jgi:hypothetical protein